MIDRGPVYRLLSKLYGWTPKQIAAMTLGQMIVYLDDREHSVNPRTGKPTRRFNTLAEAHAYRESLR